MGKYIVYETKTGIKFNLKASNGEVIADSQVYASKKACLNGVESVRMNAPVAPVEDQTKEDAKATCPKFEVYKDHIGEFRFHLKAKNGQIIAVSEGYKEHSSCLHGIESVKKNADSPIVEEER